MADMPYSSESEEELPELEHYQEYREVLSPAPVPATVVQAIHSALPDRLYTLLPEIVTTIPAAKALAEERLLLPVQHFPSSASAQSSLKRKAYEICKNCDSEFSVDENDNGACAYHEGDKEADYADGSWTSHREDLHGRIDDLVDDPD